MSFIDTLTQKLPMALDFIVEIRGLLQDLKDVYQMREKQRLMKEGSDDAQQSKDTSKLENVFQQSGPQPDAASAPSPQPAQQAGQAAKPSIVPSSK